MQLSGVEKDVIKYKNAKETLNGYTEEADRSSNDKRGIKTMIEILDMKDVKDATPEELEELRRKGFLPKTRSKRISGKPLTPYERTRAQVAATGNRWAMENFYATHS